MAGGLTELAGWMPLLAAGGNLFKELRAAAPKGIDIYFENVGGAVQAAVVPQLNDFARVPLCGLISSYNDMQMNPGPDWRMLLVKRATVTGFIVSDHFGQMEGFWKEVPALVKAGRLKYREDIVEGFENMPRALIGLFGDSAGLSWRWMYVPLGLLCLVFGIMALRENLPDVSRSTDAPVTPVKLVPAMITDVPPTTEPDDGVNDVIVGAPT